MIRSFFELLIRGEGSPPWGGPFNRGLRPGVFNLPSSHTCTSLYPGFDSAIWVDVPFSLQSLEPFSFQLHEILLGIF